MQNTSLENLIADSDFQVNCYGQYLGIAQAAEKAAKGHVWKFMRVIHEAHAAYCRKQAQAHLEQHIEIEMRIRTISQSYLGVTQTGLEDPANILGFK